MTTINQSHCGLAGSSRKTRDYGHCGYMRSGIFTTGTGELPTASDVREWQELSDTVRYAHPSEIDFHAERLDDFKNRKY